MKIGFTNGCWDCLHEGHLHLLQQARQQCDYLIVAIDDDARVAKLKGEGRPVNTLSDRITDLQAMASAYVDSVVPFYDEVGLLSLLIAIRPDLLFKGDDYIGKNIIGSGVMSSWAGRVVLIPRLPNISTTQIIDATRRIS